MSVRSNTLTHHPGNDGTAFSTVGDEIEALRTANALTALSSDAVLGTDNVLIKSDGTARKAQATGISVDDSNNVNLNGGDLTVDDLTADDIGAQDINASGTLTKNSVGVATVQTNSYTQQQGFGTATLTDTGTIAWNLQTQQVAKVTLGGNRTLDAPTNMIDGYTYILRVIQDGTGTRTLAYHSTYKFPGGVDPTLTTAASAIDILTFVSDGTNMYGAIQKNFS